MVIWQRLLLEPIALTWTKWLATSMASKVAEEEFPALVVVQEPSSWPGLGREEAEELRLLSSAKPVGSSAEVQGQRAPEALSGQIPALLEVILGPTCCALALEVVLTVLISA